MANETLYSSKTELIMSVLPENLDEVDRQKILAAARMRDHLLDPQVKRRLHNKRVTMGDVSNALARARSALTQACRDAAKPQNKPQQREEPKQALPPTRTELLAAREFILACATLPRAQAALRLFLELVGGATPPQLEMEK